MAEAQPNLAMKHLFVWLHALNRSLESAITARRKTNATLARYAGNSAERNAQHAGHLLQDVRRLVSEGPPIPEPLSLDRREAALAAELLARQPAPPPLSLLTARAGLTEFEQAALVIVTAPAIDPAYGRIYGYLRDDLSQCWACPALILQLALAPPLGLATARRLLGPGGRLRRIGLVLASEPLSDDPALRLSAAPGLADWLIGASANPPLALDDLHGLVPLTADRERCTGNLATAARALRNSGAMTVAIWGTDTALHEDRVLAIAAGAERTVRRAANPAAAPDWRERLLRDQTIAATSNAVLWLDCTMLADAPAERREAVAECLAARPQRVILTGAQPWRPLVLLAAQPCYEVPEAAGLDALPGWQRDLAGIAPGAADEISAAFGFARSQRRAAINLARAGQTPGEPGQLPLRDALNAACQAISAPAAGRATMVIRPRRTLADLVLPDTVHRQVAEIAALYGHAALVDGDWGFGRISGSSGAIKVLFTGDPGTGKTLAAEAIAAQCRMHLLKVDLSQVVSKWIGETEQNLEEVFRHAEQCRSVLFFDEAEALFGKRGEVRHGTDRYANMEVSYLLQRLESFSTGVVVLSSNLRDEIDPAFTRRFQVAVNFPRPQAEERLRIWQLAFERAPCDRNVDLPALAEIDLTGGGIVTAARMAALLAAAEGQAAIHADHVREAIDRQFNKEARLMPGLARQDGLSIARSLR